MKQEETNIRPRYARPYIPNAVFYLPFGYYYAVRLGTLPKMLSWMLIYLMPTAFYSAIGYEGSWGIFALSYALILLAVFSLYEFGYIFNDTIAIHYEAQPAIRLYDYNFAHFAQHYKGIITLRCLYSLAAIGALYALHGSQTMLVGMAIAIMCMLFAVYNRWRSRYNVWLYPFLVCSRYIPFMLLSPHPWEVWLLLFLSFPLLNALERFSMPRYRWPLMRRVIPTEDSKTIFRVAYYGIVALMTTAFGLIASVPCTWFIPLYILFAYRALLALWLRKHQPENYLNG